MASLPGRWFLVGVVIAAALATACQPREYFETATMSGAAAIRPHEQLQAQLVVEVDADDIRWNDIIRVSLSVEPRSDTAVVVALTRGNTAPPDLRAAQIWESEGHPGGPHQENLAFSASECAGPGSCSFIVDATVGNLGDSAQDMLAIATLKREADKDAEIEIPSLRISFVTQTHQQGQWATPGPIPIGDIIGEPTAHAISIETTINDSALFDFLIREPLDRTVHRQIEAVVGPDDPVWALKRDEPPPSTLIEQATCTESGCRIDVVAIFQPRHEDDWWVPIVVPRPDPTGAILADGTTTIRTREVAVSTFEGDLGQSMGGTLALELDAPLSTSEVILMWDVHPVRWYPYAPIGHIVSSDGTEIESQRWLDLECDERCRLDAEMTWQAQPRWEGEDVAYFGYVIGGSDHGVANDSPPDVIVRTDPHDGGS